jgi:hypothetical protein
MAGMCAYLIKEEDKEIHKPIARIAIKRFVRYDKYEIMGFFGGRSYIW